MTDPLSQMVSLLQPAALRSKVVSGAGHWRVDRQENGHAFFCVVLHGYVRLDVKDGRPMPLHEGDFVLIPASDEFSISGLGEGVAATADPYRVTMLPGETRHGDPQAPADVRLLVGHFAFSSPDSDLLVRLLPSIVHIRQDARLAALVRLITDEALQQRPARDMVLAKLLEVLLVEALRSSSQTDAAPAGILRGLADPRLASAIRSMHEQPTRDWTVEHMAEQAALSRSAFFNRFRRVVGITPMDYLLSWRMALAKSFLKSQSIGLQEVAERTGYGSASAFSTAFKRFVGMPPSLYAEQTMMQR